MSPGSSSLAAGVAALALTVAACGGPSSSSPTAPTSPTSPSGLAGGRNPDIPSFILELVPGAAQR